MALKNEITIDGVVDLLNELIDLDTEAVSNLISSRVPCNEALADHPTVQVGTRGGDGTFEVGVLGLLNGLFGVDDKGYGAIVMTIDSGQNPPVILGAKKRT